jgi:type II secretory pathway component GspD/PulD (secretin)
MDRYLLRFVLPAILALTLTGAASASGSDLPPPPARVVTADYEDVELREILRELAKEYGVTILGDESIDGVNVSIRFSGARLEDALEDLATSAGVHWKERRPGVYLMGGRTRGSRFFGEFAQTERYVPQHQAATSLAALLPPQFEEFIAIDELSNVLTITAPEALLPRIREDLRRIDAPSRQIVVEAVIAEISSDSIQESGFSWNLGQFGYDVRSGLTYSTATAEDLVRLRAMVIDGRATLRANPRLSAFEGRQASITVGQETWLVVFRDLVVFPRSEAQVIQTGITLRFVGYVSDDGWITLHLQPEVSDAVVTIDQNPTTAVRRANTHIRVRSGETIAIGGLNAESQSRSVHRVPILGQIPLLGELFTQRRTIRRQSETIILITPRLSEDEAPPADEDRNEAPAG